MIHLFKTTFNRQKCKGHTEAVSKLRGVSKYLLAAVSRSNSATSSVHSNRSKIWQGIYVKAELLQVGILYGLVLEFEMSVLRIVKSTAG